jgi:hypothetical protein
MDRGTQEGHAMTEPLQPPEMEVELPCQACGCHAVFTAVAPPGERANPLYLRCCQCGRERTDLADLYNDLPRP